MAPPVQSPTQAAVLENLSEGLIIGDDQGQVFYWNTAALTMCGYGSLDECQRQLAAFADTFEILPLDEDRPLPLADWPMSRVLRGEQVRDWEGRLRRRDQGWEKVFAWSGWLVRSAGTKSLAVVSVADITARKQAEATVQQERDRLSALVASMQDEVWFADPQKRFTLANPAALREFGLATDGTMDVEKLAASLEVLRPDGSPRPIEEAPPLRALTGEVVNNEEEIIRTPATGEPRYRQVNAAPVKARDGRIIGSVSVVRDITERKRVEIELRNTEERYRLLFESNPNPMFVFAEHSLRLLAANEAMARQYGWSVPELLRMKITKLRPPRDVPRLLEAMRSQPGSRATFVGEWRHQRKDGSTFDAEITVSCLDYGGHPARLVLVKDISDRKAAEAALRASEELTRQTLQALPANVAVIDSGGRILAVNQAWLDFAASNDAGASPAVAVGANYLEVCRRSCSCEAGARSALAGLEAVLRGKRTRFDMEYPCHSPREQRWFSMTVVPLRPDGAGGAVVTHINITARKQAEEALRTSFSRLELAMDAAQAGAWETDLRTGENMWDSRIAALMGISAKAAPQAQSRWLDYVHPEDRARVTAAFTRASRKGGPLFDVEFRVRRADGEERWFADRGIRVDQGGLPSRMLGVVQDITERKHVETRLRELNLTLEQQVTERTRALSEREQHLRAIVETAADGILTLDAKGRIESANPAALKLFGYAPGELVRQDIGRVLSLPGHVRTTNFLKHYQSAQGGNLPAQPYEISGQTKSGRTLDLELTLTPLVHLGRQVVVAMVHDVTRRKRLERELVLVSERERQQVGRELHDELGQVLHGLHFLSSDLVNRLRQRGVKEAVELARIGEFIEEALTVTRSLARGLQPVPPVPEGLMKALREHAARVRKLYGVSCRVHCAKVVLVTDPTVANHLFRIAQEATTNAIKHSGCKRILLRLKAAPGRLVLGIRDDGHGRFPSPARRRGMGLHVMQFRASAINGSLAVQRTPGGGTEVTCTVKPVANPRFRAEAEPISKGTP